MTAPGVLKPTRAQIARRQDKVVELTRKGYASDQVAAALGVHIGTITSDRSARRRDLAGAPKTITAARRLPDPEPFDWLSEPPPEPVPPGYVLTSPVPRLRATLDYLKSINALSRFAFNISEAQAAGDNGFIVGSQVVIADLMRYLKGLQEVAQDASAQEKAKLPESRDDLSDVTAGNPVSVAGSQPLPPRGAGILPGRVYNHLWAYGYAGLPVTDDVVRHISNRSGLVGNGALKVSAAREARVRRAVQEMRAAGLLE